MYSLPSSSSSSISSIDSSTSETISSFWERGDVKAIFITIVVLLGIWLIGKFFAPYFIRIDNVFFVSGAPGTGKDLICSDYALKRFTCAMRKYNFAHFVSKVSRKPCKVEKPAFYSSVPILLKREVKLFGKVLKPAVISQSLTKRILLLQDRVPNGSIVYISDINRFVNQWSYKLPCVQKNVSEFISEYRQYSKGGYFICNCQQSDQVAKEIRNCFGSCINLLHHHHFAFVHWSEMRRVSLGENMTAIETKNNDDKNINRSNLFVLVNPFIRRYDTYAYYGRVAEMDICSSKPYQKANTNVFINMPKDEQRMAVKTFDDDNYSTYFKFEYFSFFLYLIVSFIIGILLTAIFKTSGIGFIIGLPLFVCLFAMER